MITGKNRIGNQLLATENKTFAYVMPNQKMLEEKATVTCGLRRVSPDGLPYASLKNTII
ncbi:hypothetical protein [Algibacter sp. PT7-4]|uniref:hypothetical protein n=1 Tax=Algibacter ulvanivorans TaxID=3400999 RepID=UPI003AAF8C89